MLPAGSLSVHVMTTRSSNSFTKRDPFMRGLKKTQIAGTVLTSVRAAASAPGETPAGVRRVRRSASRLPLNAPAKLHRTVTRSTGDLAEVRGRRAGVPDREERMVEEVQRLRLEVQFPALLDPHDFVE